MNECKGCFGAASGDCDHCEDMKEECRKKNRVVDLTPYFSKKIKLLTGAWIVEGEETKELLLKFDERMSGLEKLVYTAIIGKNLIEQAAQEDEDFGDFIDGIQIREWRASDDERIRHGNV